MAGDGSERMINQNIRERQEREEREENYLKSTARYDKEDGQENECKRRKKSRK